MSCSVRRWLVLGLFFVFLFSSGFAWLDGWQYRKNVTSTLNDNPTSYTYHPVVNVSGAKADCSDVRVTDSSDNLLDYYVYDCDSSNSGNALVLWNYTAGNYTFYIYYGNPSATDAGTASILRDMSTYETGLDGWGGTCTVTRDTSIKYSGTASMKVSCAGADYSGKSISGLDGQKVLVIYHEYVTDNTGQINFQNPSSLGSFQGIATYVPQGSADGSNLAWYDGTFHEFNAMSLNTWYTHIFNIDDNAEKFVWKEYHDTALTVNTLETSGNYYSSVTPAGFHFYGGSAGKTAVAYIDDFAVGYGATEEASYNISGTEEGGVHFVIITPQEGEEQVSRDAKLVLNCTGNTTLTVWLDGVNKTLLTCAENTTQSTWLSASPGEHNLSVQEGSTNVTRTFSTSLYKVNQAVLSDVNETVNITFNLNFTMVLSQNNVTYYPEVKAYYPFLSQENHSGSVCEGDTKTSLGGLTYSDEYNNSLGVTVRDYAFNPTFLTLLTNGTNTTQTLKYNITAHSISNLGTGTCNVQNGQHEQNHTVTPYYTTSTSFNQSQQLETEPVTVNITLSKPPGGQASYTLTTVFQNNNLECQTIHDNSTMTIWQCQATSSPENAVSQDYTANSTINLSWQGLSRNETSQDTLTVYSFHVDDCTTYTTKSLEYKAYNETSGTQVTNVKWGSHGSYWSNSGTLVKNFSWNKTSNTLAWCISPSWALLHLNATTQASKTGFNTVTYMEQNTSMSNTTNTRGIYLYEDTDTNVYPVTVKVIDEYGIPLSGYTVYAQKWFYGQSAWVSIAGGLTDDNGQRVIYLKLYDQEYRFTILNSQGQIVHQTNPTTLSSQTYTIQVDTSQETAEYWTESISASCSWNNQTTSLECTAVDPDGYMTSATLTVTTGSFKQVLLCQNTAEGASVTITCNLSNASGWTSAEYVLTAQNTNGMQAVLYTGTINGMPLTQENQEYNKMALFFILLTVMLVMVALPAAGLSNPVVLLGSIIIVILTGVTLAGNNTAAAGTLLLATGGLIMAWAVTRK